MKHTTLALALAISGSAFAHKSQTPPHLDLEMTSAEYQAHLKTIGRFKSSELDHPVISSTIKLGTRLSQWIAKVNTVRSPENAVRLTSATTRTGIPIDKPSIYSPTHIEKRLAEAFAQTPEEVKAVLLGNAELPETLPVDDETFIKAARLIDKQYQSAARYKSVDQWRSYYVSNAKNDVRGYHYLVTNKIAAKELADVNQIPEDKVAPIKDALIKICFNSPRMNQARCESQLAEAWRSNALPSFYDKFFPIASKVWKEFFIIPANARRSDITWNGLEARVPFNTPTIAKFIPYLQINIEDEFRWEGWGLKMDFGSYPNGPLLIFQPGVVPHVNSLGGNEIVMDSNQSIEEYESKWTIRHEFGHVLGLPDCYHEFYDTSLDAYVNYQLDITDLMCSRAGNMNERIYKELKGAYANE